MNVLLGYLAWAALAFFTVAGPIILIVTGLLAILFMPLFPIFLIFCMLLELAYRAKARMRR